MKTGTIALCGALMALLLAGAQASFAQSEQLGGLKLSGDQPINIESDKLEVSENSKVAVFSGNVKASQGVTVLKAGKMEVYYGGQGSAATGSADIERIEVSGKVYVKSNNQVATGDAASFDMRSEVLVMSGSKVALSEGNNVAEGCKLTVQMKSGRASLESCKGSGGRVKLQIDPQSAKKK